MSIFKKYENSNLRNKDIFLLWLKLGSLDKVSKYLENKGVVSLKNNKRYGSVTLSRYAWRYVLDNPEEAHQEVLNSGTEMSDEYWEQLLVRRAHTQYVTMNHNRQKFYDWLEKHNLEKYKHYKSQANFFGEESDLHTIQG